MTYILNKDIRVITGITSFGLLKGAKINVTQKDNEYNKVLVDFGNGYMDWFHESFLNNWELVK